MLDFKIGSNSLKKCQSTNGVRISTEFAIEAQSQSRNNFEHK